MDNLLNFFDEVGKAILSFNFISDFLDVIFVAFLIYQLIKLVRGTRAFLIVKAIAIVIVVYVIVSALNMESSEYIFKLLFNNSIIIFLILFSPEIRQVLESVGRRSIKSIPFLSFRTDSEYEELITSTINDVCKSASGMSRKKCGALIVFEKETPLANVITTGTILDATSSAELINSIFFKNSALHDGALIIRSGKLYSAGCILPLTDNDALDSELGTRHRAALGMSEQSDAAVVVVSEESGAISLACGGELRCDISTGDVREFLCDYLLKAERANKTGGRFGKLRRKADTDSDTGDKS